MSSKSDFQKASGRILDWTSAVRFQESDRMPSSSTISPSLYALHLPERIKISRMTLGLLSFSFMPPPSDSEGKHEKNSTKQDEDVADSTTNEEGSTQPVANLLSDVTIPFLQQLLARKEAVDFFNDRHSYSLQYRWQNLLRDIYHFDGTYEEGTVDAEKSIIRVISDLAALLLLPLSTTQMSKTGHWALLGCVFSRERETKADLLIGVKPNTAILATDYTDSSQYPPIFPLLESKYPDLSPAYMGILQNLENKNTLIGEPMLYLTLLLLMHLNIVIWPEADCAGCEVFAESHRVMKRKKRAVVPPDSVHSFGMDKVEDTEAGLDRIQEEIKRVVGIIPRGNWHLKLDPQPTSPVNEPATEKKKKSRPHGGTFYNTVYPEMEKLLKTKFFAQLEPKIKLEKVMKWVLTARNELVQAFSQMTRHDLTFGALTSYNTCFLLQRFRHNGCLTLSPLLEPTQEGYVILRAAWLVAAFHDAIARQAEYPTKFVDPYQAVKVHTTIQPQEPIANKDNNNVHVATASNKDDDNIQDLDNVPTPPDQSRDEGDTNDNFDGDTEFEKESDDDEYKPKKSSKVKKRKKKVSIRHLPSPPRGGAGTGGAPGSQASTSGSDWYKRTTRSSSKRSSDGGSKSQSKRSRQHKNIKILADEIHLGFYCKAPLLHSSKFSKFLRVINLSDGSVLKPKTLRHPVIRTHRKSSTHESFSSTASESSSTGSSSLWSSTGSIASSSFTAPLSSHSSVPEVKATSGPSSLSLEPGTITSHLDILPHLIGPETEGVLRSAPIVVRHAGTILEKQISESATHIVWSGDLIMEGLDFEVDPVRIAVKLADWDRENEGDVSEGGKAILEEANIYQHLAEKDPAFNLTPRYYGTYNGSGAIALLLSYEGEKLLSFDVLDNKRKYQLLKKAEKLHLFGIVHGNLSPENVLVNGDNICLIGFRVSKLGHECPGSGACGELLQLGKDLFAV
ncbi:uncharacterized protein C8R40DRAFT_1167720 [Lentinula edodes]|uniref:uncharacterized protein n=1 Tax=Lentinula edodes TaxID=5353 RepID=UPI001E8D19DE|nr:uncharacterized protein C8R40DRAFT_1167720 [Lentinula edodes]KAH7878300.1 hypothetical protein C8R40DRAFT_1167720 [Lentinula edodes]